MTSGRVGICTGLTRRPLVVPLRDQFQHVLYTVNLICDDCDEDEDRVGHSEDDTGKEDDIDPIRHQP